MNLGHLTNDIGAGNDAENCGPKKFAPPIVSVIIPVYNAARFALTCLSSLEELDSSSHEIIFVDNCPKDDTLSFLRKRSGVLLLTEKTRGSYRARNTGATRASGAILAFTDVDCTVSRDWIRQIIASCRYHDAVQGDIARTQNRGVWVRLETARAKFHAKGAINTRNFAIKKELFFKMGRFDEAMPNGADTLFGLRLHRSNSNVLYNDRMVVYHHWENSPRKLFSKIPGYAYGDYLLYAKHGHWRPLPKKLFKTLAIPLIALKQGLRSELSPPEKALYVVYKCLHQIIRDGFFYRCLVLRKKF